MTQVKFPNLLGGKTEVEIFLPSSRDKKLIAASFFFSITTKFVAAKGLSIFRSRFLQNLIEDDNKPYENEYIKYLSDVKPFFFFSNEQVSQLCQCFAPI